MDGNNYNMRYFQFLIFSFHNLVYKDGKNEKYDPYIILIPFLIYEFMFLLIVFAVLDYYFSLSLINGTKSIGALGCAILLYFLNYQVFIKNNGFIKIHKKLVISSINTKKNRIVSCIVWILLYITMFILIGSLSYLLK